MSDLIEDKNIASLCERVSVSGDRIVVHRKGKGAAIISVEDLELLEELEEREDILLAREAMKEPGEIPFDEIKRKYGFSG